MLRKMLGRSGSRAIVTFNTEAECHCADHHSDYRTWLPELLKGVLSERFGNVSMIEADEAICWLALSVEECVLSKVVDEVDVNFGSEADGMGKDKGFL